MSTTSGRASQPGRPVAELGYRLPAEWEPHAATWIAWPHRRATWVGDFTPIPGVYATIAKQLARFEPVRIVASGPALAEARRHLGEVSGVTFLDQPTSDSWLRDTGPVGLVPATPQAAGLVAVAWRWNAWGGKYPPWDDDARVAVAVARAQGAETFEPGIVLEGGAIETDGDRTLLANERCVVDPRRNPGLDRRGMEQALRHWLGVEAVLWVEGDLQGDDTDGHIDQLARFVAPGRVLAARQPDRTDPNHASLAANLAKLERCVDARGRRLEVVPVDIPARFVRVGTQLPASHLNFYVANGVVAVPVFGGGTDEAALRTIGGCFPGRVVEPVDCSELVRGRGGLHCITRDQPAVA